MKLKIYSLEKNCFAIMPYTIILFLLLLQDISISQDEKLLDSLQNMIRKEVSEGTNLFPSPGDCI